MRNPVRKRHAWGALAAAAIAVAALPGTASADAGTTITGVGGKCLDVRGSGTANGTPVQIYGCNGTGAQSWTVTNRPDFTGVTLSALGKCLDVSASGTTDGTKVQLWDCNGTEAQRWVQYEGPVLINPQSNKCLDVPGGTTQDGTQLQIYTCNFTTPAQQWYFHAPGASVSG
ncbi:ricin-type beta-trefoil lectin domain protein [Kitasatospora sp. NPDC059722]|uniref:ricin-type beta-trefoil lectin domain protein n=1 Tax=unclassified Kitasatospora TaxID=2633591 RepID=UPI00368313E5